MTNHKAVSFPIFTSLIMLGAAFFLYSQPGIVGSVFAVALGFLVLSLFSKIFAR